MTKPMTFKQKKRERPTHSPRRALKVVKPLPRSKIVCLFSDR